jgi:choline kinase
LNPSHHPSFEERANFYTAYLETLSASSSTHSHDKQTLKLQMQILDRQVEVWSPASHAMWAIWGLVQAREDVESQNRVPEFDYTGYAIGRMEGFRREIKQLGIRGN